MNKNLKISMIGSLIEFVYKLDNTPQENIIYVLNIDEKLNELSKGQISVRYWIVNNKLHCTHVYMDSEIRKFIEKDLNNDMEYSKYNWNEAPIKMSSDIDYLKRSNCNCD